MRSREIEVGHDTPDEMPSTKFFPEPEDVFAENIERHRRVLQPLLSISTAELGADFPDQLHFVCPLEPYDGLLGEYTRDYHSGYCRVNWIAFEVIDGRYRFMGDFRYFRINAPFDEPHAEANEAFEENHYTYKEESYAKAKQAFRDGSADQSRWQSAIELYGGLAPHGNWCVGSDLEIDDQEFDDDGRGAKPLTKDGRPFQFVGSIPGYSFRKEAPDSILLFFDPKKKVAVLTFDWT